MKENTEKVVVIFDRVDQTAITVIESLGGEIQKQEADNFKEKEVELLVPDSVKFYDWGGDIALEVSEGVILSNENDHNGFVLTDYKDIHLIPIKCKLVPVKYEDIQVGDFVILLADCKGLIEQYSMKHGDKKFCGMLYSGSFTFNKDWRNGRIDLLKVVRC
jgi:hypothetical protein